MTVNCGLSEERSDMSKDKWQGFTAGFLLSMGVTMGRQDMLGLDKYVEYLKLTWVHMSPLWSVIPIAIGLALMVMSSENGPHS